MRPVMSFSLHSASISRILEPSPQGLISSMEIIKETYQFILHYKKKTFYFMQENGRFQIDFLKSLEFYFSGESK